MTTTQNDPAGVLHKAFEVLSTFGPSRRTMSLSDITRRSGLPKTTVHRVLRQMVSVGAVDRVGERYCVGMRMFALSRTAREVALRDVALPHLTRLSRACGNTVHLAVLCDTDVLYLEKLDSRATAPTPSAVGVRVAAHCTAVGKVLLAHQEQDRAEEICSTGPGPRTAASIRSVAQLRAELLAVRASRFALDREEAAPGLCCLAVPVTVSGRVVAGLSIAHASSVRLPGHALFALLDSAARLARELATVPGFTGIEHLV